LSETGQIKLKLSGNGNECKPLGIGITTVLLTLVTLIFCEIAPKSIAVQHATAAGAYTRPLSGST
jgi:Mg2+/Co2+ transporter CorB